MILETSFIIDVFVGDPAAVARAKELDRRGEVTYVPAPALFELWEGVARARRPEREVERIQTFLASHPILPLSDDDAREAGLLAGRLARAGRTLGTIDALIAGMAKARRQTLLTSDRRLASLEEEIRVEFP